MRLFPYSPPSPPESFVTCAGNRWHTTYTPKLEPDGSVTLSATGRDDIQERIQSYLPCTDISSIVARIKSGDVSMLRPGPGAFGDFSEVPTTFAEIWNKVKDGMSLFDSLPVEVRQNFNGDVQQFFALAGTDEWYQRLNVSRETSEIKEE